MKNSGAQNSLLPEEEDLVTVRQNRSWNPLGRSGPSPDPEYALAYHESRDSFSDEVFREVGLGIHNDSGDTLPARGQRESFLSSEPSQPNTPGYLKTPQGTPGFPTPHLPNCPSRSTVLQRRFGWVPVSIFLLAFYSTAFSGVYLAVAFWKPRWTNVGTGSSVAASTANLLCAFFAKTIELAYVTICVAFLGQVLSRRAMTKDTRGISISDMSMRAWIMQPGSMLVRWQALRYSALTFLGAMALTATIVAMLYTTAAEALVSPKLKLGPHDEKILWGKVSASFANSKYLAFNCQTPIPLSMDEWNRNLTCLQIEHAGMAYHNYQEWVTNWSNLLTSGNETSNQLANRPKPTGSIWDNTTVTGSWIEIQDITDLSKKYGRMVNNITMAFPHGGIPAAAMDERNEIPQPQEATGEGKYNIEASVTSPAVNVLCVGMTESELAPIVYSTWPNAKFNATTWSVQAADDIPKYPSYLNSTVVDDIFGFGEKYNQVPPVFGTYPKIYNTILNNTGVWPSNGVYLVGKPQQSSPEYVMCSIRVKETGVCSTRYDAASSGAFLSTHCEDSANKLQYNHQVPTFAEGLWSSDWKDVGTEWSNSLSLGSGITTAEASNERLIMQFMPSHDNATDTYSLNPNLPSVAEALAVMAGCTLIVSTQNAPFVQGWNYTDPPDILSEPAYQNFRATLQVVGYASGGTEKWQGVFYVILILAFLTSAVCLIFMIIEARGHQITDFTEPQNLFALALNSPQSARLRGACGCGPAGSQMKERWFIGMEESDEHFYIRAKADGLSPGPLASGLSGSTPGARSSGYARINTMDFEEGIKPLSPAVSEFRKVSKRGSWLAKFY